ncbi:MAG: hypothetical protein IJA25_03800 [Anaerotignum sp.]|nr:hypothetical protein [Anaerotignum sp.]
MLEQVSAISRNIERYSFFLCKNKKNLRPTEESQFKSRTAHGKDVLVGTATATFMKLAKIFERPI